MKEFSDHVKLEVLELNAKTILGYYDVTSHLEYCGNFQWMSEYLKVTKIPGSLKSWNIQSL